MRTPLWRPTRERIKLANITRFIEMVNAEHDLRLEGYFDLHRWSVEHIPEFWSAMWQYAGLKSSSPYQAVVDDLSKFPGASWFPGAKVNFAENLLRYRDDRPALLFRDETGRQKGVSYAELYRSVGRLARALRESGIKPGDRVVAYMPNLIETAVAMLAATSVGAVWSSCATDIGPQAAVERLGQVKPKVLFTVDGYYYRGKLFNVLNQAADVARGIPSIEQSVVVANVSECPPVAEVPLGVLYDEFLAEDVNSEIDFEQLPFDHPLYIMFSSGTTGKPKCMVQGAGGVLINHLKELLLHTDLQREDVLFYITTCSWMMWNWQLSGLATGCAIVLYDGNPTFPDDGAMWRLVQDEGVTVFGCSASYINHLRSQGLRPGRDFDLTKLKEISQTGSALSEDGFQYVYREVKADLHFNSISGGTDINGCFAAGSPISPVYAGELQGPALAMKVKAYDEIGRSVYDCQGELVCEAPAPSMPLRFWDDRNGEKYQAAYFDVYPGVWRHGDYIVMHSDTGGVTFYGRSDATLKPSGVRIGPSEIYNQLEQLPEIADSLAIGQYRRGDQRILLFVKLTPEVKLDNALKEKIKTTLRAKASPRHVPALIFEVPEIPYTLNMKKVESAVTNIVNGRPVTNRDALMNPQSLDYFEKLLPDLQK